MMVSMGAVGPETPVVTIVHDCQVLPVNGPSRATATPERAGGEGGRETETEWSLPSLRGCREWWPSAGAGSVWQHGGEAFSLRAWHVRLLCVR